MAEVASGDEDVESISQIVYPLMQALDIVHLDIDLVVGATDQRKIHMLAREALPRIGYEKPTYLHHPLTLSLTGGTKMSSRKPETMLPLHASPDVIRRRVTEAYCPAGDVEGNPVLQ